MMRSDDLNLHVYPVRMEMTDTKHIPTSLVCSAGDIELTYFLVNKTLSRIYSTDEDE